MHIPLTTKIFLIPGIVLLSFYALGLYIGDMGPSDNHVTSAERITRTEPVLESTAVAMVADLEAKGMKCQTDPTLTDTIVFVHMDGTTETVTFDEALALGKDGAGYVRAYCS